MMKTLLVMAFILEVLLLNCKSKARKAESISKIKGNKSCIQFNDSGIYYLTKYSLDETKAVYLDTGLLFFDKAIMCDTNYLLALSNKMIILNIQKKYNKSLAIIEKMISLAKRNPQFIFYKGLLLEIIGDGDSARSVYDAAELGFNEILVTKPDDFNVIGERLLLIEARDGKESATRKLEEYFSTYPNNSTLNSYKVLIDNFDKEKFLNGNIPDSAR